MDWSLDEVSTLIILSPLDSAINQGPSQESYWGPTHEPFGWYFTSKLQHAWIYGTIYLECIYVDVFCSLRSIHVTIFLTWLALPLASSFSCPLRRGCTSANSKTSGCVAGGWPEVSRGCRSKEWGAGRQQENSASDGCITICFHRLQANQNFKGYF